MVGDDILPDQENLIDISRVVHASVDPTITDVPAAAAGSDEGDEAVDPDRVITNARPATQEDGLLSSAELLDFFAQLPRLRSTYDIGLCKYRTIENGIPTFGDRVSLATARHGLYEPEYTSYTHYWQTTLGARNVTHSFRDSHSPAHRR